MKDPRTLDGGISDEQLDRIRNTRRTTQRKIFNVPTTRSGPIPNFQSTSRKETWVFNGHVHGQTLSSGLDFSNKEVRAYSMKQAYLLLAKEYESSLGIPRAKLYTQFTKTKTLHVYKK